MHVYFDPKTLLVTHVVTHHDATYDPASNGEHFLTTSKTIAHDRILLVSAPAGDGFTTIRGDDAADWAVISIAEKMDMPITGPARVKIGEVANFHGVPDKVAIAIDGVAQGAMEKGGHLEFTPLTTGFYAIAFTLAGFMDKEVRLEVVDGH